MKRNGTAKRPLRQGDKLQARIEADLQAIQRNPQLVRSFFREDFVLHAVAGERGDTTSPWPRGG